MSVGTETVSLYATFASREEAGRIGRAVVEEGLAACVNILAPCSSIYHWQGAIEEAEEVPAIFKTSGEQSEALMARIVSLHSYDIPAVAVWSIAATTPAYARWILDETAR